MRTRLVRPVLRALSLLLLLLTLMPMLRTAMFVITSKLLLTN